MPFSRIKHICFDVEDIEANEALFSQILGVASTGITVMPLDDGRGVVKTTFFHFQHGSIELAYHRLPESWRDSPLNTGPGFHHIAFETPSLDEALLELAVKGIKPLPRFPLKTPRGRIAFLDPRQTGGLLIELCETEQT